MAQLAVRLLPIPDDPGSIILLNVCFLLTVCSKDESKEKEAGKGPFKKDRFTFKS